MNGSIHAAPLVISIATALLAGFFSLMFAMISRKDVAIKRDTSVTVFFGIAFLLISLNVAAASLVAALGLAYSGLLKVAILLTGAFAIAGMVFGLVRGLQSGKATARRSA